MRKLIFLDIDGVVAGLGWLKLGKGFINPECVKLLNSLEGAEVVISSSWGNTADKPLKDVGLTLPIVGHTEHLSFQREWTCRGNEIEKWLMDNFGGMCTKFGPEYKDVRYDYVILDDDCDFLLGQSENFVRINAEKGLTKNDIKKVRKILKI